MGQVIFGMVMSLDGYVGGQSEADWASAHERLLGWVHDLASWREKQGLEGGEDNASSKLMHEEIANVGAYVMGRTMFDFGEQWWGDNPPFHAPVFVLTHRAKEPVAKEGGTSYTFVTEGIASTVRQAQVAAGDKDVFISGGASTVQAVIGAGLLDAFQLHLVPVLLGAGVRLFAQPGAARIELERTRVVETPLVTHLRFRVVK